MAVLHTDGRLAVILGWCIVGGGGVFAAPPQITWGPISSNLTSDSGWIHWDTSEKASSVVRYGVQAGVYDDEESDATLEFNHAVELMPLESDKLYHYIVVSEDDSGLCVTSQPSSFQTDPAASDVTVSEFVLADTQTFEFRMDASGSVDRVEFMMDGEVFAVDYTAPFRGYFYPGPDGMTAPEMLEEHVIMARAYNQVDEWRTMSMARSLIEDCYGTECDILIREPWRWLTIFTDSDVAPATNVLMEVEASQPGLTSRSSRASPGFPRLVPTNIPVREVEFYLDGNLKHTATSGIPGHPMRYQYTYDCTGISTGFHYLRARAITTNGCPFGASVELEVERRLPMIRLSREAWQTDHKIDCGVRIDNVGDLPVMIDRVVDTVTGFQIPWKGDGGGRTYNITYDPATRRSTIDVTFTPPYELPASNFTSVSYSLLPVMYPDTVTYRIGGEGYVDYHDAYDAYQEDLSIVTRRVEGSGATVRAAVTAAWREANYLAVTSPRNLFARNPEGEVNLLLQKVAGLCARWDVEGALGYIYPHGYLGVEWVHGDLVTAGNIFASSGDEVAAGDVSGNRIRVYTHGAELTVMRSGDIEELPISRDLYAGDSLAMGDTIATDINGDPHTRAEILVAQGSGHGADEGRMYNYHYEYVPSSRNFGQTWFATTYNSGDGFASANVLADTGDTFDEVIVANADDGGRIDVYYSTGALGKSISTDFSAADQIAVGPVLGGGPEEQIVVACYGANRLDVFAPYGVAGAVTVRATHPCALSAGDCVGVGDVWGDAGAEIVVADESEDTIRVYEYVEGSGLGLVDGFDHPFESGDRLLVAPLHGGSKAQILVVGPDSGSHHNGRVDVVNFCGGDSPGDRWTLDELINEGETWADRLADGWDTGGHLLVVGETDIVPTFTDSLTACGGARYIGLTDQRYASTTGSRWIPELSMARIVGDTAADMTASLQTILDVRNGVANFRDSEALMVSGYDEGPSGGSDDIEFADDVDAAEAGVDDAGFSITRRDTEGGTYDRAAFFADATDKDFIFLTGHGSPGGWDIMHGNHVAASFVPGDNRPLVYASSCKTARYTAGRSFAEAWLQNGAVAYIGATENGLWYTGREVATRFCAEYDQLTSLGHALMRAKQVVGGMGEGDENKAYRYNCAVFSLFGDPSMRCSYSWLLDAPPEPRVPPLLHLAGALDTVAFTVPDCIVTNQDGLDHVSIPGQPPVFEPGKPLVPTYSVLVDYPAGSRVHDVTLTVRDGLRQYPSLNIPLAEALIPGAGSDQSSVVQGANWWPDSDFTWSVEKTPGDTSRLHVRAHPFFTDIGPGDSQFYSNFTFSIDYTVSDVAINRIVPNRDVYESGETADILVYFANNGSEPIDLTFEAEIIGDQGTVATVNPVTLEQAQSMCSYSFLWGTGTTTSGHYAVEVTLKDGQGELLDRDSRDIEISGLAGEMTDLQVAPTNFVVGDDVALEATFANSGAWPLSGTLVIRVFDANGELLALFTHEFSDLAASGTVAFNTVWSNASVVARSCRIAAYALYDGKSSEKLLSEDELTHDKCHRGEKRWAS